VILCEVAEVEEIGTFEQFCEKLKTTELADDGVRVTFTNLEGDTLTFCWKEDGNPTVNGVTPDYGDIRINDPRVRSAYDSGIIDIDHAGACRRIDASDANHIISRQE